ncbi:MAG: hypothetical protein JWN38_773 [Candidatus Saccharibacteria bacterium]|nr:hypothetical protein [Candidatus Saccharibacteria bacterium]
MSTHRRTTSVSVGLVGLVIVVAYVLVFIWYLQDYSPRPVPTAHTNFWWGLVHGFFALPDFIVSLFKDKYTMYQTPNQHGWYNFGFLLGIGAFGGGAAKGL